jgi:predicted transcriptional regulator
MDLTAIKSGSADPNGERWFNALPDEIKESITKGLQDAVEGNVTPHAEVLKKYLKWLKK